MNFLTTTIKRRICLLGSLVPFASSYGTILIEKKAGVVLVWAHLLPSFFSHFCVFAEVFFVHRSYCLIIFFIHEKIVIILVIRNGDGDPHGSSLFSSLSPSHLLQPRRRREAGQCSCTKKCRRSRGRKAGQF